jgi:hypothetical protein
MDDDYEEFRLTPEQEERFKRASAEIVRRLCGEGRVYTWSTPWEFGDPFQEFYRGDPGDETASAMTESEFRRAWDGEEAEDS